MVTLSVTDDGLSAKTVIKNLHTPSHLPYCTAEHNFSGNVCSPGDTSVHVEYDTGIYISWVALFNIMVSRELPTTNNS